VAQLGEHLLSKYKVLSSNPKRKRKKRKKVKRSLFVIDVQGFENSGCVFCLFLVGLDGE
jgi:hypothetical protein